MSTHADEETSFQINASAVWPIPAPTPVINATLPANLLVTPETSFATSATSIILVANIGRTGHARVEYAGPASSSCAPEARRSGGTGTVHSMGIEINPALGNDS
jgi:hypothetical protein